MRVNGIAKVLLLAMTTAACGAGAASNSGRLRVVAAFYPLQIVAARLGGDLVSVTNLTPPGAEPHDVELKPSDARTIRDADLILYLADGFQPALENAIRSLPNRKSALDLLAGLPLKGSASGDGGTPDPHVWLSPDLMKRMTQAVAETLVSLSPAHSSEIRGRATAFESALDTLDQRYHAALSHCSRHEIFTSHAAFAYLADRYGLQQIAITGLSPQAEPSPARLREVTRLARANHATTIFFETLVSPRVAQAVARIVGANTAVLDPIEGLSDAERKSGGDYFSVMRSNLSSLTSALGCAA